MSMNKFTLFVKVANHLIKQGQRSRIVTENDNGQQCLYRGPNNMMCAAGCLIEDQYYDKNYEGVSVGDSRVQIALIMSGVDGLHLPMVRELQVIHDQVPVFEWPRALQELAAKHDLYWKPQ